MTARIPTADEIDAMGDQEYKVLENRLRRAAARQGLRLEKSRRRDQRASDYGTYWLIDGPPPQAGGANWRSRVNVAGGDYGMTLKNVAADLFAGDVCDRCLKPAPDETHPEHDDWEPLGAEGDSVVCPDCITPEEQQAMDEVVMDLEHIKWRTQTPGLPAGVAS